MPGEAHPSRRDGAQHAKRQPAAAVTRHVSRCFSADAGHAHLTGPPGHEWMARCGCPEGVLTSCRLTVLRNSNGPRAVVLGANQGQGLDADPMPLLPLEARQSLMHHRGFRGAPRPQPGRTPTARLQSPSAPALHTHFLGFNWQNWLPMCQVSGPFSTLCSWPCRGFVLLWPVSAPTCWDISPLLCSTVDGRAWEAGGPGMSALSTRTIRPPLGREAPPLRTALARRSIFGIQKREVATVAIGPRGRRIAVAVQTPPQAMARRSYGALSQLGCCSHSLDELYAAPRRSPAQSDRGTGKRVGIEGSASRRRPPLRFDRFRHRPFPARSTSHIAQPNGRAFSGPYPAFPPHDLQGGTRAAWAPATTGRAPYSVPGTAPAAVHGRNTRRVLFENARPPRWRFGSC